MMQELLQEIVAVLIKHDINVELDSAQIELNGAEIVFRCKDLSKVEWEREQFQRFLDDMRIFNHRW